MRPSPIGSKSPSVPACAPWNKDACTKEELEYLKSIADWTTERRAEELQAIRAETKRRTEEHDKLVETLQEQYKNSNELLSKWKKDNKMKQAILTTLHITKSKDEV